MSRAKVFISIFMVLILIALSAVSVWAAPEDEEAISGKVQRIVIEVDETTGTTTVLVTLVDEATGETQTVRLSLVTATTLGLVPENIEVVIDPDGTPISGKIREIVIQVDEATGTTTVLVTLLVDEATGETQTVSLDPAAAILLGLVTQLIIDEPVEIAPEDVIEYVDEEGEHPVALALANFFDLEYDTIMGHHENGFGFGVIAQACWMAYRLAPEGENNTEVGDILDAILAAKKSHVFTDGDGTPIVTLPNGEIPKNWGQFRNAVLKSEKPKKNLGYIMSGRAEGDEEQEEEGVVGSSTQLFGKGKDKGGKPDAPPGKVKNKDKGKGGGKKQ